MAIVIVVLLGASATGLAGDDLLGNMYLCNCGGGGGGGTDDGGGSGISYDLIQEAENRTSELNTSNSSEVEDATHNTSDMMRENLTEIRDSLLNAQNLSNRVHAAHDQAYPNQTSWDGVRTNVSKIGTSSDLGDAVTAVYEEIGEPLTDLQENNMRLNASEVPNKLAEATAAMTWASIDAMHYLDDAFRNVSQENVSTVHGNASVFRLMDRGLNLTEEDGNLTANLTKDEERVFRANGNLSQNIDYKAIYQASDVLAKAIDVVRGLDPSPNELVSTDPRDCAEEASDVYLATPDCLVVIGKATDGDFKEMAASDERDRNIVLVDLGGEDSYVHRAGGGHNPNMDPPESTSRSDPIPDVQVNVDLGFGDDSYRPSNGNNYDNEGPFLGAGKWGAGLLYDAGGDDDYTDFDLGTDKQQNPVLGSAIYGSGILVDEGGNDLYEVNQEKTRAPVDSMGAAISGFGLLIDKSGRDRYRHTLNPGPGVDYVDGGSAQGFASTFGVGYLLDFGTSQDWYDAGQTYVQGAATEGGFAYLFDGGGQNSFNLTASKGCPYMPDLTDVSDESTDERCGFTPVQIANRSQGFADTNGFGGLVVGKSDTGGDDTYRVKGTLGPRVGTGTLGSGNLSAAGGLLDVAGDDDYEAYNRGLGYGNAALGSFMDNEGNDTYLCEGPRCYGFGEPSIAQRTAIEDAGGIGVFLDGGTGGTQNDTFKPDGHPDDDGDGIWAPDDGNIGLGVDVSRTTS